MSDEQQDTGGSSEQNSGRHAMSHHFFTRPRLMDAGSAKTQHAAQGGAGNLISVPFVFATLRQWWKLAAPVGIVLASLAATAMWWMFTPEYEAQAWLRIEDRRPYIAYPTRDESIRFVSTQVELIRSPLVIGPAISKPAVAGIPAIARQVDAIDWVGKNIKVRSVGGSELFVVSYSDADAKDAATVVNEVVGVYLDLRGSDDTDRLQRTIDLLDQERDRREKEVEKLQEAVRNMTIAVTGKDPAAARSETRSARDPMTELQTQLANAEVEQTVADTSVQVLESVKTREIEVPDGAIEQAIDNNPQIVAAKAAIKSKAEALGDYETKLVGGKKNPNYIRLAEQLRDDEKRLEEMCDKLRLSSRIEMRATMANRQDEELAALKARVAQLTILKDVLKQRCDEALKGRSQVTGDAMDLEYKRAELARAEAVHAQIAQRLVTLRTEQRAPERVELMRKADPPKTPVELLPLKKIGLLCTALFFLPFGLAFAWELYVRRVSDMQGLEQHTQLPVIGEIARLPMRTNRFYGLGARRLEQDVSMFEESVDSLRTSLVLSESLRDMKVILVTSAASNEGKTSLAVQLAVSLARASGRPTLLVDGDMRSPDIHQLLGLTLEPGLADVLAGECSVEDAVQSEYSDQLHVLAAGRIRTSPHRLVGNGTLRPMFAEFRKRYDYTVVDTPPLLAVSETLVLAKQADAALICAMRDTSRIDQVRRAYDRLVAASGRPVGVVLNGVPTTHYYRRYGTYGYSRA